MRISEPPHAHLRVRLRDALHGVRPGRELLGADLVLVAPRAQAEVGALDALVVRADHLRATAEAPTSPDAMRYFATSAQSARRASSMARQESALCKLPP